MTGRHRSLDDFPGPLPQQLLRAADDLACHPGTTLHIPPGDYVLETPLSRSLRLELMDGRLGDDPEKRIFTPYFPYDTALPLRGVQDCTVEGNGARFLLTGPMQAVELAGCSHVVLRELRVDCAPKPFTRARVIGQGAGFVDLCLPQGCGVTARTPAPRIVPLTPGGGFAPGCMESFSRIPIGSNCLRCFGSPDLPPCVGGEVVLIHTYHYRPAVFLADSEDIMLEKVAIHAQYGMGLLAHRCRDLTLRRFAVTPAPGACISVNTDATHFASCSGEIRLENCILAGSEDDGLNIHGYYYDPEPLGGSACLLHLKAPTFSHAQVIDLPPRGAELALYDRDSLAELGRWRVMEVAEDRTALAARVVLDRPLAGDGLLLDCSVRSHLVVQDCRFQQILTRCLLLKPETAEVTGCLFRDCPGTAVHISPEPQWREGGAVQHVLLENNRFDHVGYGAYGIHGNASVLCVEGGCLHPSPGLHGEVLFRHNAITRCSDGRPERVVSALTHFSKEES